jgi:hypothetical protein
VWDPIAAERLVYLLLSLPPRWTHPELAYGSTPADRLCRGQSAAGRDLSRSWAVQYCEWVPPPVRLGRSLQLCPLSWPCRRRCAQIQNSLEIPSLKRSPDSPNTLVQQRGQRASCELQRAEFSKHHRRHRLESQSAQAEQRAKMALSMSTAHE